MKLVLRGSNGRRSRPRGGSSLLFLFPHILYPLLSLHHNFLSVHGYSWVNSVNLSAAQISWGVRRPRGRMQAFRNWCQWGADLFLSSHSSGRRVSTFPVCDSGNCCFMQSFNESLFFLLRSGLYNKHKLKIYAAVCTWQLVFHMLIALHDAHRLLLFFFCIQLFCSCTHFREENSANMPGRTVTFTLIGPGKNLKV